MNLNLSGPEPSIDDISAIPLLKLETEGFLAANTGYMTNALDSIYASLFYFELDCLPEFIEGVYICHGSVQCRLNLDRKGRIALYQWLIRESAYFLVNGRPIVCASIVPQGVPLFKCRLQFTVADLSERVGISVRGITSKPLIISGGSQSVESLIESQMLYAPFGRVDCVLTERTLPDIPKKRKAVGKIGGEELDARTIIDTYI